MKAIITNIQGYSIHDGPGIRTVVFFKGCGLACLWCANPECIRPQVQIGFIGNLCTHCGKCLEACPAGAVAADETKHRIDYGKCTACGLCADACRYNALTRYGAEMSAEEVFDAVRRDKMFYEPGGGGVTVSGGEPLLQAPFVEELFTLCKNDGIRTCIETAGFAPSGNLLTLLPLTDCLLFDLKHMDPDIHRKYTGQPNGPILENARLAAESGADILFRMPLIPGVNDDPENIARTAEFIKSLPGTQGLQLMPYHRMGDGKYKALDLPNAMRELAVMTPAELEAVRQAFAAHGVECTLSQ
jgi:pyruvate formate lyase activating enzyme